MSGCLWGLFEWLGVYGVCLGGWVYRGLPTRVGAYGVCLARVGGWHCNLPRCVGAYGVCLGGWVYMGSA